jgi:hypothetical protein
MLLALPHKCTQGWVTDGVCKRRSVKMSSVLGSAACLTSCMHCASVFQARTCGQKKHAMRSCSVAVRLYPGSERHRRVGTHKQNKTALIPTQLATVHASCSVTTTCLVEVDIILPSSP